MGKRTNYAVVRDAQKKQKSKKEYAGSMGRRSNYAATQDAEI